MQLLLLWLLLGLHGVCGEIVCAPGMYHDDGGECQWCKPGTYQAVAGARQCVACRKGMVSDETGAKSPKTCRNCPRGTYAVGSQRCAECPLNTLSPAGAYGVLECTPSNGYYSKPGGAGMECPANFYCVQGTTEPTPCPTGTISSSVATHCLPGISSVILIDWVFGSIWIILFLSVILGLGMYKHRYQVSSKSVQDSAGMAQTTHKLIQIKVIR